MDNEKARFILRSFRPDGADVGDPDFAEALTLAMENRELGEWLASERAFDAEFANALGAVNLPESLREDIMACLAAERGDFPQAEDSTDAAWIGAFATIQPPAALRESVLAAMDRTVKQDIVPAANISIFKRLAIPLAAAAGIALAFFITRPTSSTAVVSGQDVSIDAVEAGFLRAYKSPFFSLDQRGPHQVLVQHLRDRNLPTPDKLPRGLEKLSGLGCRELVIDGKRGSLVCFKLKNGGVVHMVIFLRADVSGELPPNGNPAFSQDGKWATARWENGDKVFLVMSKTTVGKLTELF